jgi:PKD repeat protein
MRPIDIIKFYLLEGATWVEYTDGIISVDIQRGLEKYTSPWDMPDAGVMRLISRSYSVDPYENSNFRTGRTVKVEANGTPIFTGRLIDINVSYNPKGNPPEIEIIAIDMVGTMQAHVLQDWFRDRLGSAMQINGFVQEMTFAGQGTTPNEISGWVSAQQPSNEGVTGYFYQDAQYYPPIGASAWENYSQLAKSNLAFLYANVDNEMVGVNDWALSGNAHPRNNPSVATFDSRGGELGYFNVVLNDGFDILCNRLKVTNVTYGAGNVATTTDFGVATNQLSTTNWGPGFKQLDASISVVLPTPPDPGITNLINRVFAETIIPGRDITSISWNGRFAPDLAKTIEIYDNIDVYHEVDVLTIDKKYEIVGITHSINAEDWNITYSLKNAFLNEEVLGFPEIAIAPSTGDTNTVFNFSVDCEHPELIDTIVWDFGDTPLDYEGLTATHSYGTQGTYTITATITNTYGLTQVITKQQYVAGAPPTSDWTWAVNPSNSGLIEFTYTGTPVATGPWTEYLWTFGDGGTGNNRLHPVVGNLYTTGGNKTVSLTTTNAYGSSTTTKVISVTPGTVTNNVGNRAVRYLRLVVDPGAARVAGVNFVPLMSKFRALTSTTATNRALDKPIVSYHSLAVDGFRDSGGNRFNPVGLRATCLTDNDTTNYGIRPVGYDSSNIYRMFEFVIDLGQPYYDLSQFRIALETFTGDPDYSPLVLQFNTDASEYFNPNSSGGWALVPSGNPADVATTTLGTSRVFVNNITLPINW